MVERIFFSVTVLRVAFSYLIFKRPDSVSEHIGQWRCPTTSWEMLPRDRGKKSLTNSWKSREEEWMWRVWTLWTREDSHLSTSAQLPPLGSKSHRGGGQPEAYHAVYKAPFRGGACSRVTPLAATDWRGISRVWASKQVKAGAATTSVVISGEKLETKWEIATKIEVSQLRG